MLFAKREHLFFWIQPEPACRYHLVPLQYFQNKTFKICIIIK
nr:MAG TPA: hypothetical protein [Caudoviricetes sp.]